MKQILTETTFSSYFIFRADYISTYNYNNYIKIKIVKCELMTSKIYLIFIFMKIVTFSLFN